MSLNAKEAAGSGGFRQKSMDAGTYPARLIQVIDLGVQDQRPFEGKPKDPAQEIHTTYEILDEFCVNEEGEIQEDKPRWVSEDFVLYNLSSERANSTKRYYALDPKEDHEGDWGALLGSPVNIILTAKEGKNKNKGRIFNNIGGTSTMRPKEAEKAVALVNPTKHFDLDDPDMDVFMSLPQWLQDRIKKNHDFEGSALQRGIKNYKAKDKKEEAPEEDAPKEAEDEDDGEW